MKTKTSFLRNGFVATTGVAIETYQDTTRIKGISSKNKELSGYISLPADPAVLTEFADRLREHANCVRMAGKEKAAINLETTLKY